MTDVEILRFSLLNATERNRMLSIWDINRRYYAMKSAGLAWAGTQRNAMQTSVRTFTTDSTPKAEGAVPKSAPRPAEALYNNAVRKQMGPIAMARRVSRTKGNFKYLAGIVGLFFGIYYYSVWKVGQDDFSDVDSEGNVREKV